MKEFVIAITETLSRNIVVRLEDDEATADDAVEFVENLCNDGIIDLDSKDFLSRDVQDETEEHEGTSLVNLKVYDEKELKKV